MSIVVLDPAPLATPDPGVRTVALGRLRLPTYETDLAETLGDGVETIGARVFAGERRARRQTLTLPLRGDKRDADPFTAGARARRQARGLLDNTAARLPGLYLRLEPDPELNGWLACGGGELAYDGVGIVLDEYKLELEDPYIVGRRGSHRQGLRLNRADRRLATTPRDTRGMIYSTDFAASPALAIHALPIDSTHVRGVKMIEPGAPRPGLRGSTPIVVDRTDSELVSFELDELAMDAGDVLILDRRGAHPLLYTPAGDVDPQTRYGWEEVYGPAQPLSGGVPLLDNGLCRVRWVAAQAALAVEVWTADGLPYAEQGRLTLWQQIGLTRVQYGDLEAATVVEWTPERAVIRAVFAIPGGRGIAYITLQRGWPGPRVELYTERADSTVPGASIRWTPIDDDALAIHTADLADPSAYNTATWTGNNAPLVTSWPGDSEPWVALRPAPPAVPMHFAILQADLDVRGHSNDVAAYGSPARQAISFDLDAVPYCSVTLGRSPGLALALERRTAPDDDYLGVRDLAQANLTDARQTLALLPR